MTFFMNWLMLLVADYQVPDALLRTCLESFQEYSQEG